MLDSNGTLQEDIDLQNFVIQCELNDLHAHFPAPTTFIGATDRRIDHILGCQQVLAALASSGSLSFEEGPQSDHRGLFVDLHPHILLNQPIDELAIAPHNSRLLKSGIPESVITYHQSMHNYYTEHDMVNRIDTLYDARNRLSDTALRQLLEKWDLDQGRAMQHAEAQLSKKKQPYQWSPQLRNAGILYRYWRLRRRELTHKQNYTPTFQRLELQTQQHDPSFRLPFLGIPLPISEIKVQVTAAKLHLKSCQLSSTELRFRCYTDLQAAYANDPNPETKRKLKIVTNTLNSEKSRAMNRNIRQTVKPSEHGSLSRLLVPRHTSTSDYPDNFQEFVSTTDPADTALDSILDKDNIDAHLLRFNKNHFQAAAISPCGHGTIHDKLTFTGLSKEAHDLLHGTLPPEWHGNNELLREFLTSFIIPDRVKYHPPIISDLTAENVKHGFGKWKESTSTSPSGRHLGHYKALIHDDLLLQCLTKFMQIIVQRGLRLTRWCNAVNIKTVATL